MDLFGEGHQTIEEKVLQLVFSILLNGEQNFT